MAPSTAKASASTSTRSLPPAPQTPLNLDLDAAEFTPIKGRLARAFLQHKASLDLGDASDEWILLHVDDVAFVLMALCEHALAIDDKAWLRKHIWWRLLAHQLSNELPTEPLDG
jgi:hypothetical protein